MSPVAWVILSAILIPIAAGVVVVVIMKPHGPWDGIFESVAYATGVVVAPLVLAAIGLMVAHPSHEHGDQEAAVQVVFIGWSPFRSTFRPWSGPPSGSSRAAGSARTGIPGEADQQ